ncbi:hypothetical protein NFK28_06525 [Citrobacter braakii]|uniref:hypothetical protein n=1 Tax=Citrobacter braakii TaxID=57706 RepID=UPI0024336F13|nr:hypothetical protein [Citrobacter braakii]WFY32511.1 hypothetical protein NFK28_06525 [Citrobacter braakii]
MGEISVKTGNNARNGGKNSLNRLIRCVCGKKIGPDPRNFNQRVSLGRNDLLIRTFPKWDLAEMESSLNAATNSDVLKPYSQLLQIITFLSQNKIDEAFCLVNKIPLDSLPIGYLPSAFSVIKMALKVKLERKK